MYINLTTFQSKAQAAIYPYATYKNLPQFMFIVTGDCEYVNKYNRPNRMITTQKAIRDKEGVIYSTALEHPTLGINKLPSWSGKCIFSTLLGFPEVEKTETIDGYLMIDDGMFFAPADSISGNFSDFELCRYIQKNCTQDARMKIDTNSETKSKFKKDSNILDLPIYLQTPYGILQLRLKITDLSKVNGATGLKDTALSLGIRMEKKDVLDDYKTNMLKPYKSDKLFNTYLEYSCDDAEVLLLIRSAANKRNERLFDLHGLQMEREFLTMGALVADINLKFIEKYIGGWDASEFFEVRNPNTGKIRQWKLEDLLHRGNSTYYASRKNSMKDILALVQGGRAKNELPLIIKQIGAIADIDLAGAYVSIQKQMYYPVGLPTVYGNHTANLKEIKLGDFLFNNEHQFIPRCWQIVVRGELNQYQTLVPSKVIDASKVNDKFDPDDPKINADFRIYTNEVINGIITSDVLEVLRNVCSSRELKEWMNLTVVAAIWYPKHISYKDPEEWYRAIETHKEKTGNCVNETIRRNGTKKTIDNRARHTLLVPINEFLEPYANERKKLKSEMKKYAKKTSQYEELDALQTQMKLVGNTNYGVYAAPYFDIGQVVIANNITATARCAVWLTSVALGCVQSITDGGAYNLNGVRYKTGKVNMDTLSKLSDRSLIKDNNQRYVIKEKPLSSETEWIIKPSDKPEHSILTNGVETYESKEGLWSCLDKAAIAHVKEFFRDDENPISLLDFIEFEHKDVYIKAIYHSQTNYQFHHVDGTIKTKARGHKLKGSVYENEEESNVLRLFEALDNKPNSIPPYKPQYISQILKVNQANEMLNAKTDNVLKQNNLLAGDSLLKKSWIRPISLSMFFFKNDKQFKSWNFKALNHKGRNGYGLEQYFLNEGGSLDYERAIREIHNAIQEGKDWIHPVGGRSNSVELVQRHPYEGYNFIPDSEVTIFGDEDL